MLLEKKIYKFRITNTIVILFFFLCKPKLYLMNHIEKRKEIVYNGINTIGSVKRRIYEKIRTSNCDGFSDCYAYIS